MDKKSLLSQLKHIRNLLKNDTDGNDTVEAVSLLASLIDDLEN